MTDNGWQMEGVSWSAPTTGTPVYRLYNPNNGDHHYTLNQGERDQLIRVGWRDENIGWNSDDHKATPIYRAYNPNAKGAGSHHYTSNKAEIDQLVTRGWKDEGIGWYGAIVKLTILMQCRKSFKVIGVRKAGIDCVLMDSITGVMI